MLRQVKRNAKRGETSRALHETRTPVFRPVSFHGFKGSFIGKVPLQQALVSHFVGIGVKRETRGNKTGNEAPIFVFYGGKTETAWETIFHETWKRS
jgi:hypothetical protein